VKRISTFSWHWWLLLGLFGVVGHAQAESQAARVSSGFSFGSDGAKVMNPQGSGLGINFDGRFLSTEVSILGNNGMGNAVTAPDGTTGVPPRLLPPVQPDLSRSPTLSNPDLFFKNIGGNSQVPAYRRPTTLK